MKTRLQKVKVQLSDNQTVVWHQPVLAEEANHDLINEQFPGSLGYTVTESTVASEWTPPNPARIWLAPDSQVWLSDAIELMDNAIREALHSDWPTQGCDQFFVNQYCHRHLDVFGKPFAI